MALALAEGSRQRTAVSPSREIVPSAPSDILDFLDRQLETVSREEYAALVGNLQAASANTKAIDPERAFMHYLPNVFRLATSFADRRNVDWAFAVSMANHSTLEFIETRQDVSPINFGYEIQPRLNRSLIVSLDNPFVPTDSFEPYDFLKDPELAAKDERDRVNVYAIKKGNIARKILKEVDEKEKISPITLRMLARWDVDPDLILASAPVLVAKANQAWAELIISQKPKLTKFAAEFNRNTDSTYNFDDVMQLASEALLRLAYDFDNNNRCVFGAFVQKYLKNRMIDIARGERQTGYFTYHKPKDRKARAIYAYMRDYGKSFEEAVRKTGSTLTPQEARKLYKRMQRTISLSSIVTEDGKDVIELGDTLVAEESESGDVVFDAVWDRDKARLKEGISIILEAVSLSAQEREVIQEYWLEGKALEVIGEGMNISKSRASRISTKAISKIRRLVVNRPELQELATSLR